MNCLSFARRTRIIGALVERNSIRSTERMTEAVKFYEVEPIGPGHYSPPKVIRSERTVIAGNPDRAHISTSLIERQDLTMRMSMRRFTRLTFSKKVENMQAAVSLHFAH